MLIKRDIQNHIENDISKAGDKKPVIIIYGARQVGKTTLVKQILSKFPGKTAYYNCDYLDVQQKFAWENAGQIGEIMSGLKLLVLDEAQRIKNIGLVLKILADEYPGTQVIATGSSSFELSNQVNEPLTGRKKVYKLFPFSFDEIAGQADVIEKKRLLENKLRFGMYPGLLGLDENESVHYLKEICSSYLFKDIFAFQQIKKPEALEKLLQLLALQIGHEVSFNELSNSLRIDQAIVQRYIYLLEESFVIFRLGAFSRNLRNEILKSRKIFFWDTGIRNSIIQNHNATDIRNDRGALWENFCIAERLKRNHNHRIIANSYFWRTYQQKEIDYIEEKGGDLKAFEFKWNPGKNVKIPRDFSKAYPGTEFGVITPDSFNDFF